MIVVCEGVDGGGKTTLARLLEQFGYKYVHNGPPQPEEDLFTTYTNQLLEASGHSNVVFDRLHLGEYVYGPVMRGKSLLTLEQLRLLNRLLHSIGGVTVLCLPFWTAVRSNYERRQAHEYLPDLEKLRSVYRSYHDLIPEYEGLPLIQYDYQHESNGVITLLEAQRAAAVRLLNRGIVGSSTARYLIVGERTGLQPNPQAIDLAFYSAERCSHYLNSCLWEAGYRESELAFTNAYRADGKPRNLAPWPGTTIALGGLAQRRLDLLQYKYHTLPHPAYQVRFKKRERWRYVELLRSFREDC